MKLDVLIPRFDPKDPKSAVENMMLLAEKSKADVFAFIHDDVEVHEENWEVKLKTFFDTHPDCAMVGFGGAVGLGVPDMYKIPYELTQLIRIGFRSNMTDAEQHGERVTEPCKVAVLDGFSQIIRRTAYERVGGWKAALDAGLTFHMYDAWMACMLARAGLQVWMLPLSCTHHGGRTSTSKDYNDWLLGQGIDGDIEVHRKAHVIIYNEFRDVLPL